MISLYRTTGLMLGDSQVVVSTAKQPFVQQSAVQYALHSALIYKELFVRAHINQAATEPPSAADGQALLHSSLQQMPCRLPIGCANAPA